MAFDLFFLDEDMGAGVMGTEVIRRLNSARATIGEEARRVLLVSVTANGDQQRSRRELFAAGADLVWNKPLPSEQQMLSDLLNARAQRQGGE